MSNALLLAGAGTGFTFLMTTLGAAVVFFFRKAMSSGIQKVLLGFAAGVMIAASVWSLLIPAIEEAENNGQVGWIPAAGGFVLGIAFLYLLDLLIPHLRLHVSFHKLQITLPIYSYTLIATLVAVNHLKNFLFPP